MMNYFTKDELEDLIFCVKDHTGYQGDSIHENLINKIQSMIDNYCEHEFYANGCGNNMFAQCHKCGEIRRVIRK